MAIIYCKGCHVGQLISLDTLYEIFRDIPLPGGKGMDPTLGRLDWDGADGVAGKMQVGCHGGIEIRTNPREASLSIFISGLGSLEEEPKEKIRQYLDEQLGPREIHFS